MFIATDGDECAYVADCNERSARIAAKAQEQLRAKGYKAQRVRMSALCSVCAEPFVKHMGEFSQMLKELGPDGQQQHEIRRTRSGGGIGGMEASLKLGDMGYRLPPRGRRN